VVPAIAVQMHRDMSSKAVSLKGLNEAADAGCPKNSVLIEGNCYASRDFEDPHAVGNACESNHVMLPDGWELATHSDALATSLKTYPWGTYGLLLKNPSNPAMCVETCSSSLTGCEGADGIYDGRSSIDCMSNGYAVPSENCAAVLIMTKPPVVPTPAPTPVVAKVWKTTEVNGYCVDGQGSFFDGYKTDGLSLDACQTLCASIPQCVSLTYITQKDRCVIHTANEVPSRAPEGGWDKENDHQPGHGKSFFPTVAGGMKTAQCWMLV